MLIDSLLLLFSFTDFVQPVSLIGLAVVTLSLVYLLTPQPMEHWDFVEPKTLYRYLQAGWLGQLSLAYTFWPFFILFNGMLFYIDYRANNGIYTIASWRTTLFIFTTPLIAWTGAVWRSSEKCRSHYWAVAARFLTIAAYFDFALRWIISEKFPGILFTCEHVMVALQECY